MTRILTTLSLFLGIACDQPSNPSATDENEKIETTAADKSATAGTAPNNTDVNERDRDGATLTPEDQGNNPSDLAIAQRVRQAIVGADALTMTEKNVKVIAVDGTVTLRGPVESEESKAKIATLAKDAIGVKSVDNQLEVTGTASASADKTDDHDETTK